jgi:hypothetical protein
MACISRLPSLVTFGNFGNPNGNLYEFSSSWLNLLTGRQITRLADP